MKILAGMDLGSESVKYCVMDESGTLLKRGTMGWSEKRWKAWVEQWGVENLEVAFETGPEAHRAERRFRAWGVRTYPFHAGSYAVVCRSKRKTDKIDAGKIVRGLRGGYLPARVVLPDDETLCLRNLVSERQLHQKQLLQAYNRVHSLARQWGVGLPKYQGELAERWWHEVVECFEGGLGRMVQRIQCSALSSLQALEQLEEETAAQVEAAGLAEVQQRLQSVPGVGPVVSQALVAYLQEGARFSNGRQFASYVGLVPSVDQTGKQPAHLGHITREGPAVLRRLLVQAAHAALRGQQLNRTRWKQWYTRLEKRRGRKRAIVALARKLGVLCYALVRDGTRWEPDRLRRVSA